MQGRSARMESFENYPTNDNAEFESPFLQGEAKTARTNPFTSAPAPTRHLNEISSPFLNEDRGFAAPTEVMTEGGDILGSIYNREFEDALNEIALEAGVFAERYRAQRGPATRVSDQEVFHGLAQHFSPLALEAERLIETLRESYSRPGFDTEAASLSDLGYRPGTPMTPAFENFLSGLVNKVKSVVKTVKNAASKMGLGFIFDKIKALVRPLLEKVLRFAINKLPQPLQPAAKLLAKKLFNLENEADEAAAYELRPLQAVQFEFDVQIASALNGDVLPVTSEYESFVTSGGEPNTAEAYNQARDQFVDTLSRLPAGADPRPAMEQFLPAVLPVLKMGISLIGRERVVGFLGDQLSKLIKPLIGQDMAAQIARPLVSTGMGLIGLESSPEPVTSTSAEAVASVVEDTVRRFTESVPAHALNNNELMSDPAYLNSHLQPAFNAAAASGFPASMIRPELRESAEPGAEWQRLPAHANRKLYKKFSKVFNATISPRDAAAIRTFGGHSLHGYFIEQQNVPANQSVTARVHVYEAVKGTWLSHISTYEKVAGLGDHRHSYRKIHPLTKQAAAILLKDAGLGVDVDPRFLRTRDLIKPGQRFYYLELVGRPNVAVLRPSQIDATIDFKDGKIQLHLCMSEFWAQSIAAELRNRNAKAIIGKFIDSVVVAGLNTLFSGNWAQHVKVIWPTQSEGADPRAMIVEMVVKHVLPKLIQWVTDALMDYFGNAMNEFIRAAENPADGVTLTVSFNDVPVLRAIGAKPSGFGAVVSVGQALLQGVGKPEVNVAPGFVRD